MQDYTAKLLTRTIRLVELREAVAKQPHNYSPASRIVKQQNSTAPPDSPTPLHSTISAPHGALPTSVPAPSKSCSRTLPNRPKPDCKPIEEAIANLSILALRTSMVVSIKTPDA